MRDVPELRAVLRNPELSPETKADIVVEIIGDADQLLRNFLRLAAQKGRIGEIGLDVVVLDPVLQDRGDFFRT